MKKYEKYNVEERLWNTEFPSHWNIVPLYGIGKTKSECNCIDMQLLSVYLDAGVIPFADKAEKRTNSTSKDLSKYQKVEIGNLVLNNQQAWRGSVGVSCYEGIVSPAYIIVELDDTLTRKFANYLFRSKVMVNQYLIRSKGVGSIQRNIYWQGLKRVLLPIPPKEEQEAIVGYLDWQLSKINKLIEVKKKEIKKVTELKKTVVNEAVTRGLNPNVPMKDSGVEWLGDIPSHWKTYRCKYLFSERDERSIEGKEQHLSMSQKYGLVPDTILDERRMLSESYAGGKICYENDLVLNRLKAHLGVFSLAPQMGVISPDYTVLIPRIERIIPAYAEAVLKSQKCRRELRVRVKGVTEGFWRLYTDSFNTIVLPVPPVEEQKSIMDEIKLFEEKTANYISVILKEVEVLHELRNKLISDVVTGQIDVRDIEVPEFEFVDEIEDESDKDTDEENDNVDEEE